MSKFDDDFPTLTMKKRKAHPTLLYCVIGALSACAIFLIAPLIPWTVKDLEPQKRLVQAVFFTVLALVVWVSVSWRWRYLGAFWVSICTFLSLHVLCVYLYSTLVQPILVWQWGVILFLESYAAVPFIEWLTRRLSRRVGR